MKYHFRKIRPALFLCIAACLITSAQAQVPFINTIAGNGLDAPDSGTYTGDGSPAVSAGLYYPSAVAMDATGNTYIVDEGNNVIRKITASTGNISTIGGTGVEGETGDNGPADSAQLNEPAGIALDNFGNIYISEANVGRIRKIDATSHIITTIAGSNSYGFSGDNGPADSALLNSPGGLAIDANGNIYFADSDNNRVRKITASSGIINTIAGNGYHDSIGLGGYSGDDGPAINAELNIPNSVALDDSGNVYISDYYNNRIRKVYAATGVITTIAGTGYGAPDTGGFSGDNSLATSAEIYLPGGLIVDSHDNIYFSDSYNNRIRKIDAQTGIITTLAGNGTPGYGGDGAAAANAELYTPAGVVLDASGNILVADQYNNRVRQITGITTAITDLPVLESISVYPNPANGQLIIQNLKPETPITITNLIGQTIIKTTAASNKYIIDVSQLYSGMYFVNGAKFIKE